MGNNIWNIVDQDIKETRSLSGNWDLSLQADIGQVPRDIDLVPDIISGVRKYNRHYG